MLEDHVGQAGLSASAVIVEPCFAAVSWEPKFEKAAS